MDKTDKLVILTLYHNNDTRMIAGRTLLQKTLYFLNVILECGIDFRAYYYGPYSDDVYNTQRSLKSVGIIEEKIELLPPINFDVTQEPRRYLYKLTDMGTSFAKQIITREDKKSQKIKTTLDKMKELCAGNNYKILSIAAKMHHILTIENKPKTKKEILKQAKALKWNISEKEADAAIEFLAKMDLVKEKQPQKQDSI